MGRDAGLVHEILTSGLVDPNYTDERGRLPLVAAALEGSEKFLSKLLMAKADPNLAEQSGPLPLQIAAWHGHVDASKLLLQASARVDAEDSGGMTALCSA